MSVDLGTDLAVAEDVAADAPSPAQALFAAITLYRAEKAIAGVSGIKAILTTLDAAGLAEPAIDAVIALAPVLKAEIADPAKKVRLFKLVASLG